MSTLWVFGDSFAENFLYGREHILEQQWHRIVARELGFDYQNFGIGGTSLDYTYHEWHRVREQITSGDLVIVAATGLERRWLAREYPRCSTPINFFKGLYNDQLDRKIVKSMWYYYKHLDHNSVELPNFYNWLCSVDRVVQKGVKTLILPVFEDVFEQCSAWRSDFPHIAFGNWFLCDINYREFDQALIGGKELHLTDDGRCNHITVPNHAILAAKILSWYKTNQAVDLTQGFQQDIIKTKISDDPDLFALKTIIELR